MSDIYRMTIDNVEGAEVQCDIVDLASPDDVDTIIPIVAAEEGIRISVIDNDENKLTPIKSKQCKIKFFNSQSVNLDTFASGQDNRFKVFVRINTKNVFAGWLEQGDISEPFQYQKNQIIELTAIDGLGFLKDIRYVDFDGVTIVNKFREAITVIKHIARALYQIGIPLNINVINNLREQDNPGDTWYNTCHIFPESFEDGINQAISCYDVLERILGHDSFLTQSKGEWWIIRVTELRSDFSSIVTVFNSLGEEQSTETTTYEKAIGLKDVNNTPFAGSPDASGYFSQAKTIHLLQRPYKASKLDASYEYPLEILSNSNLVRGDFIDDLPDETDEDGNTLTVKKFVTDAWTYKRNVPPDTQDSVEYTKVRYRSGQEVERYIHMEAAANNDFYYLQSDLPNIPIGLSDKFKIGCSIRYSDDIHGGGQFTIKQIWCRLYADDGTFWNLHASSGTGSSDPGSYWKQSDVDWATFQTFCFFEGNGDSIDFTQWQLLDFEAAPCPRSGFLEILLLNDEDPSSQAKDFSSIKFEYIPYINGSYGIFTGQSYKATQPDTYKRAIEERIYVSNYPRPLMKYAIFKLNVDSKFVLVDKFYEGQQFPGDSPGDDNLFDFGELQVRAFHNQNRNFDDTYRATCQGIGSSDQDSNDEADQFDLIHKVYNRDREPSTNNKSFQIVTLDMDLRNCEWTGTMIQNFDTGIGFADDEVQFNYETR